MMQKVALVYNRFSDKGQSHGSIERQDMINGHWCQNNNVRIQDTFNDDGYSAKTFDRPNIKQLIAFIKQRTERIDYLVVAELTRFSRDLGEAISMVKNIQKKYGIKIVSAGRNMIYDCQDATSFFMMSIEFTLGNTENLKRESDINGGIYTAKAKDQRYIGPFAPYGYKLEGKGKKRTLIIQEDQASVIRFIYDSFLRNFPIKFIQKRVAEMGYKRTGNSVIQNILVNPLYSAQQNVKPYKEYPGGLFPAAFEPIIDRLTWNQAQYKMKQPKRPGVTLLENLPLRGVLNCHCGRQLTGAASKGKMGVYYEYYKCNTASAHNNISAKKAHAQLDEVWKNLSIPEYLVEAIKEESLALMGEEMKNSKADLSNAFKGLEQVEKDLVSLEEKYIRNQIQYETYNRWFSESVSKRNSLQAQIDYLNKDENVFYELLQNNLSKLTDLSYLYQGMEITDKQELIRQVFDNRLYYQEKIYRTPYIMNIFQHNLLILKQKRLLELDEKTGFQKKSREVELSRIELESKHTHRKLSTCLFMHYLSGNSRGKTNQLFP